MSSIQISYRRILQISGPVLLTNFSYTAMGVIDTVMVGRLGVTALGAVGLGNIITFCILSFFWGMLTGVNTLTAQAYGAGDHRAVGRVLWQAIYLGCASSLLVAGVWPFVDVIFGWVGAAPELEGIASRYMEIRLLGGAGVVMIWVVDNFYRGLGRTRVMMWCGFAQLVLNCGLNYLFIFGRLGAPAMGATGAAVGTVVAQLLVGAFLLARVLLPTAVHREFHIGESRVLRRGLFGSLLRVSLPIGVQMFLEMGGVTVFTAIVARLGESQLAATNAVIQAWSVAFMGALALSVGATTLVGQSIGAHRPGLARRAVLRTLRLGYVLMAVFGALYIAFPVQLMALFVRRSEIVELEPFARPLFTVVVLCLALDLKFNVLSGALRGAGDTTYPMLVNVASAWLFFVPALLLVTPRFGLLGAWSCFILHLAIMWIFLEVRFRGSRWLQRGLLLADDVETPLDEIAAPVPALET